jgi:flagellar FliL protein
MSNAKPEAAAEAAPAKGGKKKMLIIAIAAVVLLGGGGGGAWWFMGRGEHDETAEAAKAEEKRKAARAFVTLEPFVVNLADTESDRYAQVGVVLEVEGKDANAKVTERMPAVRNEILLLISSKKAQDLTNREGKEALAGEIALAAGRQLGWEAADPQADDGDDEPPAKASKDKNAKGKDKPSKPVKVAKPKPAPPPNPVAQVHFASFIVQ